MAKLSEMLTALEQTVRQPVSVEEMVNQVRACREAAVELEEMVEADRGPSKKPSGNGRRKSK